MNKLSLLLILFCAACASLNRGPQTLTGSYQVPVPSDLEKLAKFKVSQIVVDRQAETLSIRYTLPLELTGLANEVEFTGPLPRTGATLLTGPHGKMECPNVLDLAQCDVHYKDLKFDVTARTEKLKTLTKDAAELKNRELVAMAFEAGGEPHGILTIYSAHDPANPNQIYRP